MWEWLEAIAARRGETLDDVLTWTLGSLIDLYHRWHSRATVDRDALINALRESLKSSGSYAEDTIDEYVKCAEKYVDWCLKNGKQLSEDTMYEFVNTVVERKSMKRIYRTSLRKLLELIGACQSKVA